MTTQQIADVLHCSYKTAYRCLKEMVTDGSIIRIGSDRKGFWQITK